MITYPNPKLSPPHRLLWISENQENGSEHIFREALTIAYPCTAAMGTVGTTELAMNCDALGSRRLTVGAVIHFGTAVV